MSEPTATSARGEPEIHETVAKLSDFSDRISPMIVKELRQGMRTRAFTGTFLILQGILGFGMVVALMSDSGDTGRLISRMVFFLFSVVALILQPLRGTSAVSAEIKEDTLEIMSLTRLSSLRIVLGKWASIVSQTALMLSATIPYLVMRYFFGGMQLFAELSLLFTIFFLSICLTGVTVGFSCTRGVLARALVPLALIPLGLLAIIGVVFQGGMRELMEIFSFQDRESNLGLLTAAVLAAYLAYYLLDMGVSRIAVVAENHAVRKRLVSLTLMMVVLGILYFNPPASVGCVFVVLVFFGAIGFDVCSEREVCVPSVVLPFVKRGRVGRLAGKLFYPGWHSGFYLLTILFLVALVVGHFTFSKSLPGRPGYDPGLVPEVLLLIVGVFYTLLMPLLVARVFAGKFKDPFTGFIGSLVVCSILTFMVYTFSEMARSGSGSKAMVEFTSWIPGVWVLMIDRSAMAGKGAILTTVYLALVWIPLFLMANAEFRRTKGLEEKAEVQIKKGRK